MQSKLYRSSLHGLRRSKIALRPERLEHSFVPVLTAGGLLTAHMRCSYKHLRDAVNIKAKPLVLSELIGVIRTAIRSGSLSLRRGVMFTENKKKQRRTDRFIWTWVSVCDVSLSVPVGVTQDFRCGLLCIFARLHDHLLVYMH